MFIKKSHQKRNLYLKLACGNNNKKCQIRQSKSQGDRRSLILFWQEQMHVYIARSREKVVEDDTLDTARLLLIYKVIYVFRKLNT